MQVRLKVSLLQARWKKKPDPFFSYARRSFVIYCQRISRFHIPFITGGKRRNVACDESMQLCSMCSALGVNGSLICGPTEDVRTPIRWSELPPSQCIQLAIYGRPCLPGAQTNNIRRNAVLKVSDEIQSEIMRHPPVGN